MKDPCIVVIITESIVTPYSNKNNRVHCNITVSIQLTLYITYLNINPLAEYCMPKEHHMPYRMKDQEMPKNLLKQPETHCNKRLPTALDVEGGMKRERKDLRARIIKHLRESPMTRKLKKILSHSPAILLLCLMTSSLYPKEALTLVTILIILTIVIIHRNQLQLKINNPY